jgi:5'-nucleotidase
LSDADGREGGLVRILVTNDDGIDSVGLHELARALVPLGEVVVVAPDSEYSGASAALGALHLLQPEVRRAHVDGIGQAWTVNGPPGLCVMFSRLGVFGPIDLVVSGINPGANVGRAIYHSGTVGAAITARNGGISGVAVSQAVSEYGIEGQGWDEMIAGQRWATAAVVGAEVVAALIADLPAEPVVVNVNVPNVDVSEIAGWRQTEVALLPPRTVATGRLHPIAGRDGAFSVEMVWGDPVELPPETDSGSIERGVVTISYLSRLQDEPRPDLGAVPASLDRLLGRAPTLAP